MTSRHTSVHWAPDDEAHRNKYFRLAADRKLSGIGLLRSLIDAAYQVEYQDEVMKPEFSNSKWLCVWDKDGIYKQTRDSARWFGGDFELNLRAGVFPLGSIWESDGRLWAVCGEGRLWPNEHKLLTGEVQHPEVYPPQHLKPLNGRVRSEVR